jgi:hypothetical protein
MSDDLMHRLREQSEWHNDGHGPLHKEAYEVIERQHEALARIVQWSEAYPLDIFPEPDLVKARALLAAGGITLDAISAHCMRHVIEGVGKIAREALGAGT